MKLSDLGSVFKMIDLIKAHPENAAEIVASVPDDVMAEIVKAQSAMGGGREIRDLWQGGEFHVNPGRDEIIIGAPLASRGGQVHREIGMYSDTEKQKGLTQQSIDFQATLGMMGESMKAIAAGMEFLVKKATEDKEEDKMGEDDAEKAESDAKKSLEKAQRLLAKAADMRDDADCETGPARKQLLVKAKALKVNAGDALAKAQLGAYALITVKSKAALGTTLLNQIRQLAAKSDVAIVAKADGDDDEDDKSEKSEAEKEAEKSAAQKAEDDKKEAEKSAEAAAAAGKSEAEKEAEKSAAEKAAETEKAAAAAGAGDLTKAFAEISASLKATNEAVQKALTGQQVLTGTVASMMDMVSGRSAPAAGHQTGGAPDLAALMKSNPGQAVEKANEAVQTAMDTGRLEGALGTSAQNLLAQLDAAQRGVVDISVFKSKLAVAPAAVQAVFAEAAIAA